jgi:hypothetical protein
VADSVILLRLFRFGRSFVPTADSAPQQKRMLFDHLVGPSRQRKRDSDAERPRGLEVQEQFNFRALLDRQLARLFAFEDAASVGAGQTVRICKAAAIARQTAGRDERAAFAVWPGYDGINCQGQACRLVG